MVGNDSQYRVISIGYVVENKSRQTREIEVSLIEKLPFNNGEVTGGYETDEVSTIDDAGGNVGFAVKLSNTVTARWNGDGSNRVSSPDVRRGERVEILQFGDTDEYFWRPFNEPDKSVRRRETVVTAYSNTEDENATELTPDNSYFSEVSTHDKRAIMMRTNKSGGEKFAYDSSFDTQKGEGNFGDDVGNGLNVKSGDSLVQLENSSGTGLYLDKGVLRIKCKEFVVDSDIGAITIPTTKWKGNVDMTGNLSLLGNMVGKAGGTYTFNGEVVTKGPITNNGKDIGDGHGHTNVQNGGGTTGPVK